VPGPRPRALAAALLAGAALLVAGCGGGGGGKDVTQGLSPAQILSKSQAAAKEVTSYRLGLDAALTARLSAAARGQLVTLLRQPVSVEGEGPVKEPSQASLDLSAKLGRLPVQINLTTTGGRLYLTILGQPLEPNVDPAVVRRLDLGAIRTGLLGWMTHPTEVDRVKVDGVETVHLRGGLDEAAASASVSSVLGALGAVAGGGSGADAAAARQLRSAIRAGSVQAWIGTADFQVRQLEASVRARGAIDALPGVRALDLDVTGRFSDLNEPVTITAPANARKVDLGQLLGRLGG
jgi:hypothetical protein